VDWDGWAVLSILPVTLLTTSMVVAQLLGWTRLDLPMLLGTMVVPDPDKARVVGAVMHLLNGYVFALAYALVFAVRDNASWWFGGLVGLVHGVMAVALFTPLLPGVHSRMGSERSGPATGPVLEPPGLLSLNYGRSTPVVTVAAHGLYGIGLGLLLNTS
jgi:hypothetical protein